MISAFEAARARWVPPPAGPPAQNGGTPDTKLDAKLLNYVRSNAPEIVAMANYAATRAGEEKRPSVAAYMDMANQLRILTGTGQQGIAQGTSGGR